ncbi:hypothetical protein [Amycolatopsis benzoatilytica]|uniref:hypothetical protein n=1 Tax=Amycolatopsis benzoatilytica TaxID=346045 RepID=UPI0003735503|nr:hypothetical protein [Amycolatopsis benzoatilytica]
MTDPRVAAQFVNAIFSMLSFLVFSNSAVDTDSRGMATGMAPQRQQVDIAIGIPLTSAAFTAAVAAGSGPAVELSGIQVAIAVDAFTLIGTGALLRLALHRTSR